MSKPHKSNKGNASRSYEQDEKERHYFKIRKNNESRKLMKNLDRALRSKDFTALVKADEY